MIVLNAALLGLALGALYAMLGVSFSVIYTPTKIFHFAHGAVFAASGYAGYAFLEILHWNIVIAVLGAMGVGVVLALAVEFGIYLPLRRRHASHLIVFIASASVLSLVTAIIALAFGVSQVALPTPIRPIAEGAPLTNEQLTSLIVAVVIIVPLAIFLKRSPWGIRFRAVGDSPAATVRRGVNVPNVYVVSFVLGSVLVVPAALLQGWAAGFQPEMGFNAALIAIATTLVAQGSSILAVAAVGTGMGLLQGLSLLVVPSGWQQGITYAVLLVVVVLATLLRKGAVLR
ncbi:branched-chain amino acid ABC transporter permease [Lysinimonas soli]|uniref:Branched-chain amino acid ABC transporter permease n=1 Tax=Lysinimonas soli TaxID=1074233 RepID=A0ABW0NSD8_9MICO